jgi:pimeloyl-ACP methyl ester carboxylesterase
MRHGSFLEIESGVEIYYEVNGEGTPLVFIPGWVFTTEVFDHQVKRFSKTHKVVSFDPRGVGRSTVTVQGNDYATQSADLCKLIDHLKLDSPVLIGWSYGCLPCWGFVRLRGTEPLKGLVFIDQMPIPVSDREDEWAEASYAETADGYQAVTTSKGYREGVTSYVQEAFTQRDLSVEEIDWLVRQFTMSPPWVAAAYLAAGAFSNYMVEAKQADQTLPTLFVVAEGWADRAKPYLAAHLPNAKTEVLGAHMMFWEYPEQFNAILEKYLERLQ